MYCVFQDERGKDDSGQGRSTNDEKKGTGKGKNMIKGTVETTVLLYGDEADVEVHFGFYPYCPPPRCSNHDDPRFSDPGSPEEVEIYRVLTLGGTDVLPDLDAESLADVEESALERGREMHSDG